MTQTRDEIVNEIVERLDAQGDEMAALDVLFAEGRDDVAWIYAKATGWAEFYGDFEDDDECGPDKLCGNCREAGVQL